MTRARGGWKTLRRRVSLVAVALLVSAAIAELALSVLRINTRSNVDFIPGKGPTFLPNTHYRHTREGFSEGRFNSHGFRDHERTLAKPPGTYRIAVFGDSYTEAFQVDLDQAFPARVQRELDLRCPSRRFEVLAFGQSGFGTADSLMRYRNFGIEYSPDLVILAFTTLNDFRNNHRVLNRDNVAYYFELDSDGELVLDSSLIDGYTASLGPLKRLYQGIKRRSYLVSLFAEDLQLLRARWRSESFERQAPATPGSTRGRALGDFSDLNVYLAETGPRWEEAYAVTARLLEEFKRNVESQGAEFALITLSNDAQTHPEILRREEQKYGLRFDPELPDRRVAAMAQAAGIPLLRLAPYLLECHLATGRFLHGFHNNGTGHWNEEGHRCAAEAIAEYLLDDWRPVGPGRDSPVAHGVLASHLCRVE